MTRLTAFSVFNCWQFESAHKISKKLACEED